MPDFFASVDKAVFLFINVSLANPVTNFIMPIVTNDWLLRLLYLVAVVLMLWKGNRKVRWLVPLSLMVLLLTDQVSAGLLKPAIARLRPCHTLDIINLLVDCGSGKSMPSSHATNAFGQALLFAIHFPKIRWYLVIFAGFIAMSRIFVGVHYPGDVLVGMIIGSAVGAALALLFRRYQERII